VNVAIASFLVNFLGAPIGFSPEIWADVGIFVAAAVSLTLNFFLYKKIVFRG